MAAAGQPPEVFIVKGGCRCIGVAARPGRRKWPRLGGWEFDSARRSQIFDSDSSLRILILILRISILILEILILILTILIQALAAQILIPILVSEF